MIKLIFKYYKVYKKNIPNKNFLYKCIKESINYNYNENYLITIFFVNKNKIKKLNKFYKNNNNYTDILTFKSNKFYIKNKYFFYCDIILCKELINNIIIKYKKNKLLYWARIIIHGCLHIIGYDHLKYDDFDNMRKKEIDILFKLKNKKYFIIDNKNEKI